VKIRDKPEYVDEEDFAETEKRICKFNLI